LQAKVSQDRAGSVAVLLLTGPDGQSVRAFRRDPNSDFYLLPDGKVMDSATGSEWNFQGCATSGRLAGKCLEKVELLKDYWFDWLHYHPDTGLH
jgi:hypothetical protein